MKVVVIGLGYVGSVCAACLSRDGLEVVGVDVNEVKVRAVMDGRSPVLEPGVEDLIMQGRSSGRLRATRTIDDDARGADVFLVSVGTPSAVNGASDLSHLLGAVSQLGEALCGVEKYQVINVRSTVPPGTMRGKVLPILEERSRREVGEDLGLAMNPEFLREGTSIKDYDSAPFDLCGAADARSAKVVQSLYADRGRPFHETSLETAEMVKYVNNAFHALKVGFANEIGRISRALGVDSLEVMRLLCEDRRLNIAAAYLKPGMAFGGSCLPKDLRALLYEARRADVTVPLLEGVLRSNEAHLKAAIDQILAYGRPRTTVIGLSFKSGTDDLRESPMVRLVEALLGRGIPVKIFDRNVRMAALVGSNREYIQNEIPHLSSLLVETLPEAIEGSEVIVVASDDPEVDQVPSLLKGGQILIDLFGRLVSRGTVQAKGLCW